MIGKNDEVVSVIKELINSKKREKGIVNEVIRKGDIYQYADQDESLGEIRSLYMSSKMGYIYFMSDDADARTLAKKFFSSKRGVAVKTLFDVLIMCKEKDTTLCWKDINPTVANAMQKRQDKVNKLKEIYS